MTEPTLQKIVNSALKPEEEIWGPFSQQSYQMNFSPIVPPQGGIWLSPVGWTPEHRANVVLKDLFQLRDPSQPVLPAGSLFRQDKVDWSEYGIPDSGQIHPPVKIQDYKIKPKEAAQLAQSISSSLLMQTETNDWIQAISTLLNGVKSLDLDLYCVPVNSGKSLPRYPEYAPVGMRRPKTNLTLHKGTTAYVRGEVRPVAGTKGSILTRFLVHYTPYLKHESGLEIEGFSAIDPPDMEYDRKFRGWQAVKSVSGGNPDYQNPLETGDPLQTRFDSKVEPPEKSGWMIGFNPIEDTLVAGVKVAGGRGQMDFMNDIPFLWPLWKNSVDEGRGKLILWAFLTTLGLTTEDGAYFKRFKIPFNTMPRRLGDLFQFFGPKFDRDRNPLLKFNAAYNNPNSEYIGIYVEKGLKAGECRDRKGIYKQGKCKLPLPESYKETKTINDQREQACQALEAQGQGELCESPIGRNPIPEDKKVRNRINRDRILFGHEPIEEPRGTIIDWIFTQLMKDPERLAKLKKLPHGVAHMKFWPQTIRLPIGSVRVNEKTHVWLKYRIRPAQVPDPERPGETKTVAQVGLQLTFEPLHLYRPDLKFGSYRLKADRILADKLVVEIPSLPGWDGVTPLSRPPMKFSLQGLRTEGLKFQNTNGDVDIQMKRAHLKSLEVTYQNPLYLMGDDEKKRGELEDRMKSCQSGKAADPSHDCKDPRWDTVLTGLTGSGLTMGVPDNFSFTADDFDIPTIKAGQTFTIQEKTETKCKTVKVPEAQALELMSQDLNDTLDGVESPDLTCRKGRYQEAGDFYYLRRAESKSEVRLTPDRVYVIIPDLKSKGKSKIVLKGGTDVDLSGKSHLKNIRFNSEVQEHQLVMNVGLDVRGVIEKAELHHKLFKKAVFTTKENGTKVRDISGDISFKITQPLAPDFPPGKKPGPRKVEGEVNLDLPYVGFESQGVFKIPAGTSTLRNGKVSFKLDPEPSGSLEGKLDLKEASFDWHDLIGKLDPETINAEDLISFGRIGFGPKLSDIVAQGKFKLTFSPTGLRLESSKYPDHPIELSLSIDGSKFIHQPETSKKPFGNSPYAQAIKTQVDTTSGRLEVHDLKVFEMERQKVKDQYRYNITHLEAGPLIAHHLRGSGSIWVDLMIWDYVRGLFPRIGTPNGNRPNPKDPKPLTAHFEKEKKQALRKLLGEEDFLYVGRIKLNQEKKEWLVDTDELILSLHEDGGNEQYGLVRIPKARVGVKNDRPYWDLGSGNFLLDVFLKRPQRGGSFRWDTPYRWRAAETLDQRNP